MTIQLDPAAATGAFCHEALLYSGLDEFVERTGAFILDAVAASEPILVVVAKEKVDLLTEAIGGPTAGVQFADMDDVGANPARIIPAWYDFVARQPSGIRFRGVGEPISAERSAEALVECQRHESLLNLAFAGATEWWLLCPYDTTSLDEAVIDEALASHPWVLSDGDHRPSGTYRDLDAIAAPFAHPLSPAPRDAHTVHFGIEDLEDVRSVVDSFAHESGLDGRASDFMLAANEAATNSIRHGGGKGRLKVWRADGSVVCEVVDAGAFDVPLAGRRRPQPMQEGGFGVWLLHQLCDLVQVRSIEGGSVVRLHMTIR
jgi:anti-sigma regulatory factor (Ser/Thr protein kinase)